MLCHLLEGVMYCVFCVISQYFLDLREAEGIATVSIFIVHFESITFYMSKQSFTCTNVDYDLFKMRYTEKLTNFCINLYSLNIANKIDKTTFQNNFKFRTRWSFYNREMERIHFC